MWQKCTSSSNLLPLWHLSTINYFINPSARGYLTEVTSICTSHQLSNILHQLTSTIQQWASTLSEYKYTFQYVPGKDHANTDVFSRLLLPEQPREVPMPWKLMYLLLEGLEICPVSVEEINAWTDWDFMLAKSAQVRTSWLAKIS